MCALALFAWTPVASALRARATHRSLPGSPSMFDGGNGNVVTSASGKKDWNDLNLQIGHTPDLVGPGNVGDDQFTSGSKEFNPDGWVVTAGNALGEPQGDFSNIWWANERNHATSDAFLYLALSRRASSGSVFLSFELNQDPVSWTNSQGSEIPCRTTGDLLISLEVSGTVKSVNVYKWTTADGGLDPSGRCAATGSLSRVQVSTNWLEGAFNERTISRPPQSLPSQPTTMGVGQFGEVAVNLTKVETMGAGEPCADSKFKSIWAHSESSPTATDLNSEMKDFVAPSLLNIQGCEAHPTLRTEVSPTGQIPAGTPIQDRATLSGASANPGGTMTFELFRVRRNGECAANPVHTQAGVPVTGAGDTLSDEFVPRRAGTYSWVVTYSGDENNAKVGPTRCGVPLETVTLTRARPMVVTVPVPQTGLTGASFHDTATVSGGFNPTGRVTFRLFSPRHPTCRGRPFRTQTVPLTAELTATSDAFTIRRAGTWHWVAIYSGDGNNTRVRTRCDAEPITVEAPPVIPPEVPSFSTTASAGGPVGTAITDTAHLGSTSTPTGSITFELFGPNDSKCTKLVAAETVPVTGAGDHTSGPVTPTEAGTYRWVARYSGDAAHTPAATRCGDAGEGAELSKATPAITTSASDATVAYGHAVADTAVLAGAVHPTGTITFRLYGPDDATCSGAPVFVAHQHVLIGSDSTPSPMPTPVLPGTYRWVATYSGDANNAGAATTCGDPAETFVVSPPPPIVHPPAHNAPRLAIAKQMPAHAHVGSIVPITITVHNTGSVAALDVHVTDNPPSGGRLQVTASNATSHPNGTVVWVIGTLAPGATRTVHARMRITAAAPQGMRNRASADASNAPTVSASATVRVPRPAPGTPGGPPPFTG